jgi:hypothetical protein
VEGAERSGAELGSQVLGAKTAGRADGRVAAGVSQSVLSLRNGRSSPHELILDACARLFRRIDTVLGA